MPRPLRVRHFLALLAALAIACRGETHGQRLGADGEPRRLPTGRVLDPAGRTIDVGNMPLSVAVAPDGRHAVVLLSGWRQVGLQVVDLAADSVVQTLAQPGAFLGLAFSADGRWLYASGAARDVVYRYAWSGGRAALRDSLVLAPLDTTGGGHPRFVAGVALSRDGRTLYAAENMADSLAVVDLATGSVRQRVPAGRYPYGVVVAPDGDVFVSAWGGSTVAHFRPDGDARLVARAQVDVGRHPSAMALDAAGARLFVTSSSTDRVVVVDPRVDRVIASVPDAGPGAPGEGSTPNALLVSPDGRRLFVAEADANAVAVLDVSRGAPELLGRVPVLWYPVALALARDSLVVVSGKGRGSGPNPKGPRNGLADTDPRTYTLGQLAGTLSVLPWRWSDAALATATARVARANGWDAARDRVRHPPFEHVVLIIKENRTYDQVLSDLPNGDGDTTLLFFPRAVSPNHHALAERFGLYDRFFTNAEVSSQGHPWSTSAYVTEYSEKTVPSLYADRRPERDEDGVDDPSTGWLWTAAARKGLTVRNYGEYAEPVPGTTTYRSTKPGLEAVTSPDYPAFDVAIPDQRRADAWIAELKSFVRQGRMPALEILHLPMDHTAGTRAGACTPRACMADNDLALGRIVEELMRSPFWRSTVEFVLEDDAQSGPDHVDSHRSVLLVLSPYSRAHTVHRFVNTTDVLATIEEFLGLAPLSQFDRFGRALRDVWTEEPDLTPYVAVRPAQPLDERNRASRGARDSGVRDSGVRDRRTLDLSAADRIDDALFNRVLWQAIKGPHVPLPAPRRGSTLDLVRDR